MKHCGEEKNDDVKDHGKTVGQGTIKEALATILTKKIICFGNW